MRRGVKERLRTAAETGEYELTIPHALEELANDQFSLDDLEAVMMNGSTKRRFRGDARGTRYEVVGRALDGRMLALVVRFTAGSRPLVITAYEVAS